MSNNKNVNINITFRNTEPTDALKSYASEKLNNCLHKFVHHDAEVRLVLKVEKNRQVAEVFFHVDGTDISGMEESDSLYSALDLLVASVGQQLRKHKEKITSHH